MKKNFLLLFFLLINLQKIYAQTIPNEIPVQQEALKGNGIQRVGSAPLPIATPQIEMMAAPSVTLPKPAGVSIETLPNEVKKFPFETLTNSSRVVFLNGINISTVKNQNLENVNIRIDANGNLFIDAPQYDVGLEQSFHPLMPHEVPKYPKTEFKNNASIDGVYSKETNSFIKKPSSSLLSKDFAPEVPITDQSLIKTQQKSNASDKSSNDSILKDELNKENALEKKETSSAKSN